jgi:hypothetical protein
MFEIHDVLWTRRVVAAYGRVDTTSVLRMERSDEIRSPAMRKGNLGCLPSGWIQSVDGMTLDVGLDTGRDAACS